jgi:hypothetical protein
MAHYDIADPNDPNTLVVPFIFVPQGDPLPIAWMREHPDWIRVPATFVPREPAVGESGPQWNVQVGAPDAPAAAAANAPAAVAGAPPAAGEPGIPDSFAPPAPRQKRLPNGQPWPKDAKGRDWPKDRWGRPMRPLWDYPPGVRAPGEGAAPGAPGSVGTDEAIGAARAASTWMDPATLRAILAGAGIATGTGDAQAPRRGVAGRYPGAYDVADAAGGPGTVARDAAHEAGQTAQRSDSSSPTGKASNNWHPQAGSDYLNNPRNGWTGTVSGGVCAPAVRQALREAGVDTRGHPYYARDYGGFLQQHGFHPLTPLDGYTPQQGDVAVWPDPTGPSGPGHIEWFDGQNWHSDYIQPTYVPSPNGPGYYPGVSWSGGTIYRHD